MPVNYRQAVVLAAALFAAGSVMGAVATASAATCTCQSGRQLDPPAGQTCAQACVNEGGDRNGDGKVVRIDNFLGFETIEQLIDAVIPKIIAFATSIVTIMVLWAAYQLLFSGANPSLVEQAKKTLLWTVVGYAIILLGSGIAYIIKDTLINPAAGR